MLRRCIIEQSQTIINFDHNALITTANPELSRMQSNVHCHANTGRFNLITISSRSTPTGDPPLAASLAARASYPGCIAGWQLGGQPLAASRLKAGYPGAGS